jgi:hypothetical protein
VTKLRAVLLTLFFVAVGSIAPSTASALDSYFNCVLKPSGQWCDGKANGTYDGLHSWDYVEAWYPGTWDGSVTACEHNIYTSGAVVAAGTCAANWTSTYYGAQTCVCLEAEVRQYSGGDHSINGYADSDF